MYDALRARERDRWYPLIPHPEQIRLITEDVRFKIVPAGRRSGKTERAKRFLVKTAMRNPGRPYFAGAPTFAQAKKIWWNDLKLLSLSSRYARRPSESELIIPFDNGASITVLGLDKPERIEGSYWGGGVIDEIANVKSTAWNENIAPALDTFNPLEPDYRPWAWLIGVPEGLNHYYDLSQYSINSNDPDWGYYHWTSAEILPEKTIEAAKRRMSARQFRQEYEASFETAAGRIYEDYSRENHTDAQIEPHEMLHWSHDQNFTPLSSCVAVIRDHKHADGTTVPGFNILDEIVLTSAVSRQSALEFVDKFEKHENKTVMIYGDPAGRAGEKHGHSSDYTEIEDVLRSNGWEFSRLVDAKAPAIKDRQNAVRAKICNAAGQRSLFVNPATAPWSDKGLNVTQFKEGSAFQEEQKDNPYQHITTAIGYCIANLWPIGEDAPIVQPTFAH